MLPLLALLAAVLMAPSASAAAPPALRISPWEGYWTYDLCHEDRKDSHDDDTFCRQGRDRIRIQVDPTGAHDITLCPSDPWGERNITTGDDGRTLGFRTRDRMDVRLVIGQDGSHFRGSFRTPDGHGGRVWGRRVAGCG